MRMKTETWTILLMTVIMKVIKVCGITVVCLLQQKINAFLLKYDIYMFMGIEYNCFYISLRQLVVS